MPRPYGVYVNGLLMNLLSTWQSAERLRYDFERRGYRAEVKLVQVQH